MCLNLRSHILFGLIFRKIARNHCLLTFHVIGWKVFYSLILQKRYLQMGPNWKYILRFSHLEKKGMSSKSVSLQNISVFVSSYLWIFFFRCISTKCWSFWSLTVAVILCLNYSLICKSSACTYKLWQSNWVLLVWNF